MAYNFCSQNLEKLIHEKGPLPLINFLKEALYGALGYYESSLVIGKTGDYITAPEISPLFGELIAFWCVAQWERALKPEKTRLIELGPGRGTLLKDVLITLEKFPAFFKTLEFFCLENSSFLREVQKETLSSYPINFEKNLSDIEKDGFSIIIANEFFDAFPIQQFILKKNRLYERNVTVKEGVFSFIDLPYDLFLKDLHLEQGRLQHTLSVLKTLDRQEKELVIEESPLSDHFIKIIESHLINGRGGTALMIDYGDYTPFSRSGNTLQALYKHKKISPLLYPGLCDITHQVDFFMMTKNTPLQPYFTTQGEFLKNLGIQERTEKISARLSREKALDFNKSTMRLINTQEMGALYKVLILDRF